MVLFFYFNKRTTILNFYITPIQKSSVAKCVYFFVLHSCIQFQRSRGNNKKVHSTTLPIPTFIDFPTKIVKTNIQSVITYSKLKTE